MVLVPMAGNSNPRAERASLTSMLRAGNDNCQDVAATTAVEPGGTDMTTVQLRRYELLDDMMNAFVAWWPGVIEVRATYGFKVQFGLADRDTNQFTWAVSFDSDEAAFKAAEAVYTASPERAALFAGQPKFVNALHVTLVEQVYPTAA